MAAKYTQAELLAMTEATRELSLSYLRMATPSEIAAGISWYETASGYCRQIVADHERCESHAPYTYESVTGAMAILSQQNRWNQNLADTFQAANEPHSQTWDSADYGQMYISTIGKAWNCLHDANLDLVRGPKVGSFWDNIKDPENSRAVTIDTWIRSAFGHKVAGINLDNAGVYEAVAEGIRQAADSVYLVPNQLQAIIWVLYRDRKLAR